MVTITSGSGHTYHRIRTQTMEPHVKMGRERMNKVAPQPLARWCTTPNDGGQLVFPRHEWRG